MTAKSSILSLANLHIISVVLYAGLAVLAGMLMQPLSYGVTSSYLTNDTFLSTDKTVFVTASRPLFDLEIRWALVGLLALSAVLPVLYLTKLKANYAKALKDGVWALRWIETAVAAAIMIEIVGLLVGHSDIMMLKLMSGLVAITAGLCWLAERQKGTFVFGLLTAALPWLVIASTMLHTVLYGAVRSPWFVYGATFALLAGFILTAKNLRGKLPGGKNFEGAERNHVIISLLTKVAFCVVLIVGLAK